MLIGGCQSVDLGKLQRQSEERKLSLRCDPNNLYQRQVLTNTGRTATIYLLEHCMKFGEDDVLPVPDCSCLSIIVSVETSHVKYRFYNINCGLSLDMEDSRSKLDENVKGIYIIQRFGVPYEQEIVDELKHICSERNVPIVEDITQTLLSRGGKRVGFGGYLVCSSRKWMPMTDGGQK